jgi:hypothetical protein
MALTAAQVVAQYGTDFRQGIITMDKLIAPLYDVTPFDELFTPLETDDTIIDRVMWQATGRFQKYQRAFLPLGGIDFVPNTIRLANIMCETTVYPKELVNTALDFLVQKTNNPVDAPVLAIHLVNVLQDALNDFHEVATYKGVDVPIVVGTAGTSGGVFNGVGEQIRLAKLTGAGIPKPHTNALGAVPTDPAQFVDYVHQYYDELPDKIKARTKKIACDHAFILRYKAGLESKQLQYLYTTQGVGQAMNTEKKIKLAHRDCELVGSFDMAGKNKLWSTIERNAVKAMKNSNNLENWNVTLSVGGKEVNATKDFWIGYGFYNWDWVWDNGEV